MVGSVGDCHYVQMGSLLAFGMAGTSGPILLLPKEWFSVPAWF